MARHILLFILLIYGIETLHSQSREVDSLIAVGDYYNAKKRLVADSLSHSLKSMQSKGNAYFAMGEYNQAAVYYEKAYQKKPGVMAAIHWGKSLEGAKKYRQALSLYQSELQEDSTHTAIQLRMVKTYFQLGQLHKSLKHLDSLSVKDSLNPEYPYQKGLVWARKKNSNRAIEHLLEAHKRDSTHLQSIIQLANEFFQLKFEDSTTIFVQKGLRLDPDNRALNRIKINQLRRNKEYQKAVDRLLEQVELYGVDFYAAKMLGICYFNLDSLPQATEWFHKALEQNEKDFEIYTYLGDINVKERNLKKAVVNYSKATYVGIAPRDHAFYKLGLVFNEIKNHTKAIAMFKEALLENAYHREALFELAVISEHFYTDKKIAYRHYQRYLRQFASYDHSEKINFVKSRIKKIKEDYFIRGEILD